MALVTIDRARRHLRLPVTLDDPDLTAKLEAASALVIAAVTDPDATWTDATAPAIVQEAILRQLAALYVHRGDEGQEGQGLCPEARALLLTGGYRDPVVA